MNIIMFIVLINLLKGASFSKTLGALYEVRMCSCVFLSRWLSFGL